MARGTKKSDNTERRITVYMNEEEFQRIAKWADKHELSLSSAVIELAQRGLGRKNRAETQLESLGEAVAELSDELFAQKMQLQVLKEEMVKAGVENLSEKFKAAAAREIIKARRDPLKSKHDWAEYPKPHEEKNGLTQMDLVKRAFGIGHAVFKRWCDELGLETTEDKQAYLERITGWQYQDIKPEGAERVTKRYAPKKAEQQAVTGRS